MQLYNYVPLGLNVSTVTIRPDIDDHQLTFFCYVVQPIIEITRTHTVNIKHRKIFFVIYTYT